VKEFRGIKLNSEFDSWLKTISYKDRKTPRKIMEIEWMIWNNFHYWNFVPNSTDFNVHLRFLFKFESKRVGHLGTLCSLL
jgi:hypothetical protein